MSLETDFQRPIITYVTDLGSQSSKMTAVMADRLNAALGTASAEITWLSCCLIPDWKILCNNKCLLCQALNYGVFCYAAIANYYRWEGYSLLLVKSLRNVAQELQVVLSGRQRQLQYFLEGTISNTKTKNELSHYSLHLLLLFSTLLYLMTSSSTLPSSQKHLELSLIL